MYLNPFFLNVFGVVENINCYIILCSEFFFLIALSILLVFFVIIDSLNQNKSINYSYSKLSSKLLIFSLVLTFLLSNNNYSNFFVFDNLLVYDELSIFVKNILIFSVICCILISYNYLHIDKIFQYEFFVLLGLAFFGMTILVNSNDLITMYLGIEIQSLSFYILATFKIYNNYSTEAGLKYFILGAFSSGLLLFGSSLIYGFTGTTNFYDLYILFKNFESTNDISTGLLLGSVFLLIGILFKLGAVPFHMWVPDVYDGVSTIVTAVFSIVPKIAIFTLLLRISLYFFSVNYFFLQQIILYSAIFSIIIGTLGALYQNKLKKLLAYSAISHVGFLLIGFSNLNNFSLFSLFFYISIYIIISLNIFALILGLRKNNSYLKFKKINEFVLLFKSNKLLAINFSLILFSIAGIPPLVGFYSKFYIFVSAIESKTYLVAIIAAIFSVIASMYYIRLIKLMFFKNFVYWTFLNEVSKSNSIIITLTLFLNLLFFCYPEIFIVYIYNVILNFFF